MGRRRQYLPDGRMGHYELLRLRQHAEKYQRLQTAQVVRLIAMVKTMRSGTDSYAQIRAAFVSYAKGQGFIRGWALRAGVFFTRIWNWMRGRYSSYQPRPA